MEICKSGRVMQKTLKGKEYYFLRLNLIQNLIICKSYPEIETAINKVNKIQKKLESIDIDGILDSSYIREFIIKKSGIAFPRVLSTERPDLTCQALLNGKTIIMVENSPFVLIMPGLFLDFLKSPEDNY